MSLLIHMAQCTEITFLVAFPSDCEFIKDRDHEELILESPKLPCCSTLQTSNDLLFLCFCMQTLKMTNNYTENNKGLKLKSIPGIINIKRMVEIECQVQVQVFQQVSPRGRLVLKKVNDSVKLVEKAYFV